MAQRAKLGTKGHLFYALRKMKFEFLPVAACVLISVSKLENASCDCCSMSVLVVAGPLRSPALLRMKSVMLEFLLHLVPFSRSF